MGHRNKTVNNNKAYLRPEDYAEEDVLREYRKFGVRIFESKDDAIQMVCDDALRQMDRQFDTIGIKVESSKLPVLLGGRKRQLDTHDSASSSAESDLKRFAKEQRKYSGLTLGEIEQLPEPERSYAYLEVLNSIFSRMRNARAIGGS